MKIPYLTIKTICKYTLQKLNLNTFSVYYYMCGGECSLGLVLAYHRVVILLNNN